MYSNITQPYLVVPFCFVMRAAQAEKLGDKRLSEQATKRLKDVAAAAVRRREKALYESREAVVSYYIARQDTPRHTFARDEHDCSSRLTSNADVLWYRCRYSVTTCGQNAGREHQNALHSAVNRVNLSLMFLV